MNDRPLAIDLYAGLGGWTSGLLAEGYEVVGFDIERHQYGAHRYPAQLVVQDVLTLHGSQFKDAALIVASPPCQEYSYMAMPWKLAKAKAAAIRADTSGQMLADLNRLFDACFRIQAQASLAAGRHVPMVVENVRGAQPWVGRARWNFGSFYLWGDVPALMPWTVVRKMSPSLHLGGGNSFTHAPGNMAAKRAAARYDPRHTERCEAEAAIGYKVPGFRFDGSGSFQSAAVGRKFTIAQPGMVNRETRDPVASRLHSSKSPRRKEASAMIAKIPEPLSRHIARMYHP